MSIETITLVGIAIQTAIFLLAGYAMVVRHDESNKSLKADVSSMQGQLLKLSEVITQLAVQETRVDNLSSQFTMLQRNVEDLRRGSNWVTQPARSKVDGEY
jgi:hypothetical protein